MKLMHVVGARPNFMKIAPVIAAFNEYNKLNNNRFTQRLIHTGQHYDHKMSELFFEQLEMPRPDINLEIGSGTHGKQTGQIMISFEEVLQKENPDLVIVVGDVNSTIACAIDSKKLGIPVAHIEAGLRSFDMTMPEEINRIVTDSISDLYFTTDRQANKNLENEGVSKDKIKFVGNVMIDTLLKHKKNALKKPNLRELGLVTDHGVIREYAVLTLHRPANVDDQAILHELITAIQHIGKDIPVIFPIHPRTLSNINKFGLGYEFTEKNNIRLIEPQGYLEFMNLMANAKLVLTDSGGIQEETTILNIPCLTLRTSTERPITIEQGTNKLVGVSSKDIISAYGHIQKNNRNSNAIPELWDGSAAHRIVSEIAIWASSRAAAVSGSPVPR